MNHSFSFHCDLSSLAYGHLPKGDFRPFRTAEEMTQFTGLTVEAWLSRPKPAKGRKRSEPDISEYI